MGVYLLILRRAVLRYIRRLLGGLKKDAPLIRANLRIWSKIRVFFGWYRFVNAYVERDKKMGKSAQKMGKSAQKMVKSVQKIVKNAQKCAHIGKNEGVLSRKV